MKTLRLGILGSTRGTDMLAIIAAIKAQQLPASIAVVISNKANAQILERAKAENIPTEFVDSSNRDRDAYDQQLTHLLQQYKVDLIVLIGYMRILSASFVKTWQHKIINVHPSLLPDFAGGMNNNVHAAVLAAGKPETGCTIHYVTDAIDAGPILIQKRCAVLAEDTVEILKARVQKLEGQALIEAITVIASAK